MQTIDELLEPSTPGGVGLQDVDGDGRDELIIPISQNLLNGANPNTRFAVWRAHDDSRHYERTQMVGQAVYPSGDGYLVTNGGGLASRDLTFYLPTGAGYTLVTVLTIEVLEADPATNRVLTVNCRAHQEDGLHAVDMSIRQAEDYFCNSPAAKAIWPDAERVSDQALGPGRKLSATARSSRGPRPAGLWPWPDRWQVVPESPADTGRRCRSAMPPCSTGSADRSRAGCSSCAADSTGPEPGLPPMAECRSGRSRLNTASNRSAAGRRRLQSSSPAAATGAAAKHSVAAAAVSGDAQHSVDTSDLPSHRVEFHGSALLDLTQQDRHACAGRPTIL